MTNNTDGENLSSRIAAMVVEYEESQCPDSTDIGGKFMFLQETTKANKEILTCSEGAKPTNRPKNRYRDILPYDDYRVILPSDNDCNYINASFIEDLYGFRRYIAAQGPIDASIVDFFDMISAFQITSIVCTAIDNEAGRMKFRRYWPEDDEGFLEFGPYQIINDPSSDKAFRCDDYEIRPLIISRGGSQRSILLYRFLRWFDHDVPENQSQVFEVILRIYEHRDSSNDSPILVHCSAGCGRTGSLIAIDLCRLLLNDEHLLYTKEYQIDPVFQITLHIRRFRMGLIQTMRQYLFVYKMFLFIMSIHGNILLRSMFHSDDNESADSSVSAKLPTSSNVQSTLRRQSGPFQIILRDPPIRRRLLDDSDSSSPAISPSEICSSPLKSLSMIETTQPPENTPVTYSSSLIVTTTACRMDDAVDPDELSSRTKHEDLHKRPIRRNNLSFQDQTRADAVALMRYYRHKKYSFEHEAYSD